MPVILGGPSARRTWVRGQFAMSLQYLNEEPALFVWPQHRKFGRGAFVVPLGSAWKYHPDKLGNENDIERTERMALAIVQIAKGLHTMSMEPTPALAREVYTLIADHLDELVMAKPDPGAEARGEKMVSGGAVVIRESGKIIAEHEIRLPREQAVAEAMSDAGITSTATVH